MNRTEYLNASRENGAEAHRAYYGQYVMAHTRNVVGVRFGLPLLQEAFAADENFNSLPLAAWDMLPLSVDRGKMKDNGDWLTPAGKVCILKEAARQLVEAAV